MSRIWGTLFQISTLFGKTYFCSNAMQKTKQNFCMAKLLILDTHSKISKSQGWEFAHRFSERITRFLPKTKWMTDSLKKTSDLLIRSFLVRDLSVLLMVAHLWWATWAIAHSAHFWWATWANRSHCPFLVSDLSDSLTSLIKKEELSKLLIFFYKKSI